MPSRHFRPAERFNGYAPLQDFRLSGRQDLNLRPPGPQPGALPDCATPRGPADHNRPADLTDLASPRPNGGAVRPETKRATGIEPALKAWKAFVQPQHFARGFNPDGTPNGFPPATSLSGLAHRIRALPGDEDELPSPLRGEDRQPVRDLREQGSRDSNPDSRFWRPRA